jgi:suppressor for copper-sensitivity B
MFWILASLFLSSWTLHAAEAGASDWVKGRAQSAQVRLISEFVEVDPKTTQVIVGLEFELIRDWHVYWKNPGEIGFAPRLNWSEMRGGRPGPLLFPAPDTIPTETGGIAYGYSTNVIYPVVINRENYTNQDLSLDVQVNYLVCAIQCIPESAHLKLTVPVRETSRPSSFASDLQEVVQDLPRPAKSDEFSLKASPSTAELTITSPYPVERVFLYSPHDKLKTVTTQQKGPYQFVISSPGALPAFEWTAVYSAGSRGRMTGLVGYFGNLTADDVAAAWSHEGSSADESSPSSLNLNVGLSFALLFAFLGGLILNLMPCVLPVLMLKTVGLLKLQTQAAGPIRRSLGFTALGIVTSFLGIGIALLIARQVGQTVGWGFQFQSPLFVFGMITVIFLFALNLFGLFEFQISARATTAMSEKSSSPFMEGVFATLLATPCSAPFLGSALTFALTQSGPVMLLLFGVMGLGLATPYLMIAAVPKSLKLLPKPGNWMNGLRRALGYALLVAVIWLLYVLQQQISSLGVVAALMGLLIIAIAVREMQGLWRWVIVITLSLMTIFGLNQLQQASASGIEQTTMQIDEIPALLEDGKSRYVVVTADWCLTCKYNERVVMKSDWFQNLIAEEGIELVVFDWTSPNPKIQTFLEKYGRVGIPFSMLISKDKFVVFPELLTEGNVREHFAKFKGAQ